MDHLRRYGDKDIGQYATWFESQVQEMSIGEPHLELMLDPCAASMHHRDAIRQDMACVASTSSDPLIELEIGIDDIKEDL